MTDELLPDWALVKAAYFLQDYPRPGPVTLARLLHETAWGMRLAQELPAREAGIKARRECARAVRQALEERPPNMSLSEAIGHLVEQWESD